ncbi:pyridoxamine 5'-phosphate oxidase family protein [Clostridium tagluense]|uniref:pyridoxamine 5'-phosphate oxidase family protein n=1 Tax=Clostridium tagluense TaxID=360422 RepID=UPI001C0AD8AB|nr:pyridoxamine 5'-phosphate oxidase family protein [Clostridium tagluense]MBU3130012.1 pyridoxamine 5'-phosphate oxidase family protein [Clostridium tagluense]MCB2299587.1 pyridoxamine 5'-phosphate oxidase family protein [Clostridium tagluense]MCB2311873.1 pyridoxamine 5'-phosphate oxidase family protein [Clostridium tagluense]MCB2317372.1 pyridoxamine 5'-phosphate oxidase family protein [Clostridium tagluense]MCB2322835.1 pyridoxamine 5'-phosphate oxidase family protein [Clostridium tagluens
MLNEKLLDVISHEGVVAIVTCSNNEAHVANTWNSYINATEDGRLLIPAAGMIKTQKNIEQNDKIKVTVGSKEIMGYNSLGTGFLIEGTAKFVKSGSEFDMMKEKFSFLNRVLEITVTSAKQTL